MKRTMERVAFALVLLVTLVCCKKNNFEISERVSNRFYVKNADYPIPVWVRGNTASKKIILFIQGGPGVNTLDFAEVDYPGWSNTLEKDYALAYYDQRGTGNREGSYELEEINMDTYIEDLHQVAKFLKTAYKADVVMMGHSFGGQLMYRYIFKHQNDDIPVKYISVNGVATNDTDSIRWTFRRSFLYNTAQIEIGKGNKLSEWNSVLGWLATKPVITTKEDKTQWNTYVEKLIYSNYPEKSVRFRDYLNVVFSSSYNPMPAYLNGKVIDKLTSNLFNDINSFGLINKLSGISKDVLLITGRYDDVCPPEEMKYIYDHISSGAKQIKIIEGAGHECFNHQPNEFQALVRNYIH